MCAPPRRPPVVGEGGGDRRSGPAGRAASERVIRTRCPASPPGRVARGLTCAFCATGRMGRKRNLSAAEIFDQVVGVNRHSLESFGRPLTNVVYMGMGEPLLTSANTMESIERITPPTPFFSVMLLA